MANLPVSRSQVEAYLESDEFINFSKEAAKNLGVSDLFEYIIYKEVEKMFPEKQSLAFTEFNRGYSEYTGIYFMMNRIAIESEILSSKTYDSRKKEEIMETFVDFILIHELTHLQQFKKGHASELREQEKISSKQYIESKIEREANRQAYDYLVQQNPLKRELCEEIIYVFNNKN